MTSLRFSVAFLFLIILNISQHSIPHLASVTGKDWLFLFIVAAASGVISLFIYYRGLKYTTASVATLAELGFPMAAVIINWIFIPGSQLLPMQLVGIAILLFAVYRLADVNEEIEVIGEVILP